VNPPVPNSSSGSLNLREQEWDLVLVGVSGRIFDVTDLETIVSQYQTSEKEYLQSLRDTRMVKI